MVWSLGSAIWIRRFISSTSSVFEYLAIPFFPSLFSRGLPSVSFGQTAYLNAILIGAFDQGAAGPSVCQEPRFGSLPPSQIVLRLADEGRYLGSESSFYRVLHEVDQQHHRGRADAPARRERSCRSLGSNRITLNRASARNAFPVRRTNELQV